MRLVPVLRVSRGFVVCLVAVVSLGVGRGWASKDSVPDWVRTAAQQTLPKYPADTNAVVLLDDTEFKVSPNGQAVEHKRRVVKILRPQGREDAQVVVWFNKDRKILSLHVWSIGPDGHEYALNDREIGDFGTPGEGGELYSDDRYKLANAPGRDPGGVVAFEYEQRQPTYINEEDWRLQEDIPSLSKRFTLEMPPGYTFATSWAHTKPLETIDLEHQRWLWEAKNVPAIDLEHVPMHPSYGALEARMALHFDGPGVASPLGNTWLSIGQWYSKLSRDRLVATPEITAKANELVAGKTDFYDRTEAIGEFVQKQVRYFVVELGVGGWQPHAAGDIYRNHYGDCKDKATLLTTMLGSVGIHGGLVLVDTERGVVDPAEPSMFGNHMIAAIEVPKGYESTKLRSVVMLKDGRRFLIFDPTWEKTAFGQLESNLQGGYGLLADGDASQLIEFPVLDPTLNTIHRTASFQLGADGVLQGSVTDKRFGDISEDRRHLFEMGTAKEQQEYLDRVLQRDLTSFSMSDLKVENVQALNKELTTSFHLSAERYGSKAGTLLMVRPRVLGGENFELDHKPRTVPINLGETMQMKDDFTIALPEGYVVDELPEPVKLDVGFASYESVSKVEGNVLHYTRTYTVREVTLPAERYPEYRKLAEAIGGDEQSKAVLKKK